MISVVIPCFNYARHLSDCIKSLIGGATSLGYMDAQSVSDFEAIIVNDASKDDTARVAAELEKLDSRVRLVNLAHNRGTAGAFNAGIEVARGNTIMQLSADDMLESYALERFYQAMVSRSFVYGNQRLFAFGRRLRDFFKQEQRYDFEANLIENHIPGAMMYPRQAWLEMGGIPDMPSGREDWATGVALGAWGYTGVYLHDSGYLYRRENQNRSTRNQADNVAFATRMFQLFEPIYEGYRPMLVYR